MPRDTNDVTAPATRRLMREPLRPILAGILAAGGLLDATATAQAEAEKPASLSGLEVVPSLLWVLLIVILATVFRRELRDIVGSIVARLKSGVAFKGWGLEFEALPLITTTMNLDAAKLKSRKASDEFRSQWNQFQNQSRGVMLVHQYVPSGTAGQVYDVVLYLVERNNRALRNVDYVEYYFGPNFQDAVYTVTDEGANGGFPMKIAAFARFICVAKVHFVDDVLPVIVCRYGDFEMGNLQTRRTDPPTAVGKAQAAPNVPQ
jgi:hypothetical protein